MKTNAVVTEATFSIQPDENTMKHIVELKSLNEKLSETLKCFYRVNDSIRAPKKPEKETLYDDVAGRISEIENNITASIICVSESIGTLCADHLIEQVLDGAELQNQESI